MYMPIIYLLPQWFSERRGLAGGIIYSGIGVGGALGSIVPVLFKPSLRCISADRPAIDRFRVSLDPERPPEQSRALLDPAYMGNWVIDLLCGSVIGHETSPACPQIQH